MAVFVLDRKGKPLMPCTERRARIMLNRGRARIHKMMPFTIRLVDRLQQDSVLQPLSCKIDPGSKVTGLALLRTDDNDEQTVVSLIEITHRGAQISEKLTARAAMRRRRRSKNLRYRKARFLNRGNKNKGWIAPSIKHRVDTSVNGVKKLQKLAPLTSIAQELVKFDMQKMDHPEIAGIAYQQGTLMGFELKEYVLEKFKRQCMYCDVQNVPLELEHIIPQAKGGTNRLSNLGLSCRPCNQKKGAMNVDVFVSHPERLKRIKAQLKTPLKDGAAVNITRFVLLNRLKALGLEVMTGTCAQTKFNRKQMGIPKTHALDAVCVGNIGKIKNWQQPTLQIKCTGRGSYQRTRLNQYGFPRGYLMRTKRIYGFMTGDMVKAMVLKGKKIGTYTGRVAIRESGYFNIQTQNGLVQGISHRYCKVIQRGDGYGYQLVA